MSRDRSYTMEVAVQPPARARVAQALYAPLVVRVHIFDARGAEIAGEDELGGLFVQAALYGAAGGRALAPPDAHLLAGRLARSLDLAGDARGAYALFPDLTITRAGRYRVGVSLFQVAPGAAGGRMLAEARSDVVAVGADPASPPGTCAPPPSRACAADGEDAAATRYLEYLAERGARVPQPPPP